MFKPATGGNIFFNFLKAKNEEQLKNKSIFYCSDQKQFCPFWGHEIFFFNCNSNFLFGDCSLQ